VGFFRQTEGKDMIFFEKIQKILVPHPLVKIGFQLFFAPGFKIGNGFFHDLSGYIIQMVKGGGSGIE